MSVLMSSTLAAVSSLGTVLTVGFSRLGIEGVRHLLVASISNSLDTVNALNTAEARAARILHGLGFTKEMQAKKTKVGSDFANFT